MAVIVPFDSSKHFKEDKDKQIRALNNIYDLVNVTFNKYENLTANDKILKKEFDRIKAKINYNLWLNYEDIQKYLESTNYFLNKLEGFDEDNEDYFTVIIHTLLTDINKDKYLNLSLEFQEVLVKTMYNSDISYSYYGKASEVLISDEIKDRLEILSKSNPNIFRKCQTILDGVDFESSKKHDYSEDIELLKDNNKITAFFFGKEDFDLDDIYMTAENALSFINLFGLQDYEEISITSLEKIKKINLLPKEKQQSFFNDIRLFSENNNINLFEKVNLVLQITNIYLNELNNSKVVEVNFENRKK